MAVDQETTTVDSGADSLLDRADMMYSEPTTESEATDEGNAETEVEEAEVEAEASEDQEDEGEQVLAGPDTTKFEFDSDSNVYSFKSNGKTVRADAAKLIDNFQSLEGHQKETEKLVSTRKALETEHGEKIQKIDSYEKNLEAVADELQKVFLEQEQKIDWEELRDTDISEYTRQRELQDKRQSALQNAIKTAKDERSKREQETIKTELDRLDEEMGWVDDVGQRNKDIKILKDYFKEIDLPEDALKSVYHHKIYKALHDAAKYRELKASVSNAKKEVKAAPKSVESKKTTPKKEERSAIDILYGGASK